MAIGWSQVLPSDAEKQGKRQWAETNAQETTPDNEELVYCAGN